ncbi:UNVERIFIED_CONTAM: hypothetical protein Sradi_6441800 [Sesamum radiatum]|uniref:Endonuclease/exonuclease/phosphatase domain-containing protein n=1 Tax=Sesamum radiatum TaxID=300843 RepID=A0AAW2K4T2_SESRA
MNLLVWNCQGLGGPWTIQHLGSLIRDNNPSLVVLAETKCSTSRIEYLKRKFDMYGLCVPSRGKSGGLASLWPKQVNVLLQSFSHHHIDVSVQLLDSPFWWRFTGLYGEPDTGQREITWKLLSRLHDQSRRAWFCAGDFNEILDQSEKLGGPPRPMWQIRKFREALEQCELVDLGFAGTPFTWLNRHSEPNTVYERLDRACANLGWSQLFPDTSIEHVPVNCSDHVDLVICLMDKPQYAERSIRPWRFEAAWLQSEQCEGVVEEGWGSCLGSGEFLELQNRLNAVRLVLKNGG